MTALAILFTQERTLYGGRDRRAKTAKADPRDRTPRSMLIDWECSDPFANTLDTARHARFW